MQLLLNLMYNHKIHKTHNVHTSFVRFNVHTTHTIHIIHTIHKTHILHKYTKINTLKCSDVFAHRKHIVTSKCITTIHSRASTKYTDSMQQFKIVKDIMSA